MTGMDALQSVQFVTIKGKRLAVVDMDDWEALIEWLETVEDTGIVRDAYAQLKAANGDRTRAGWLKWDDVKNELE
jgi:hypothetical protein